ncbi:hypothetical protein EYC84_004047 [Monilinia fructicola]|uniref:Chitin-binding type-4 domain-containing protein n=1 Tax=Monilinia fructicola TaxID=38448 RepID=A0A5M9K2Y3_MONFR|nr:hypothetical protein EYC84_004047 [Monilinia fructicola]
MQYTSAILLSAAGLISSVSAHGSILTPAPRVPGPAMAAACGQQVEVNQASDHNGNIQGMLQVAASQSDYNAAECQIWLCKGYKFADNTNKVQSYTGGQVVPFTFNVAAPHTGTANVSVVDTASNTVIKTANETSFSVTIPEDLGSKCAKAGDCVIQHWWNAASIDQTYESCVDFTVGGGSSTGSSSSAAASSVASSTAAASSTVAASSSAAASSVAAPSSVAASSSVAAISTPASSSAIQSTSFSALPTHPRHRGKA